MNDISSEKNISSDMTADESPTVLKGSQTDDRKNQCIHELFEAQVKRSPDAIAVVFEKRQLTYRQLNAQANQLANYLKTLGVKAEVLVGICVERSLEMIVGLLGILKAGGAYVPLDPTYPQERLAFMLADSQVSVLLTQKRLLEYLPNNTAKVVCLDTDWENIAQYSQENLISQATEDNLAYVIYTSGSTGTPKGVMIQHKSLVNYTEAVSVEYQLNQNDKILQFASVSFDISVEEIYSCLSVGATLVLRTDGMLATAKTFWKKCQEWQITVLDLPTAYWHELTAALEREKSTLPLSIRLVIIGGEKALLTRLKTWYKYVGEQVRLVNTYGPTETTVSALMCDLPTSILDNELTELPIGKPVSNTQAYILDSELKLVPVGTPGELFIGGIGLARGYLNRPDLTAEKFITNFTREAGGENLGFNSERLYKTGDIVRCLPDGNFEFIGRVDQQVKIRGFRIELGEIESILSQHPAVQEAVVVDQENIPGQKRLVAYIVSNPGSELPEEVNSWNIEHVSQAETLYNEIYNEQAASQDPTLNFIGWNSSYTDVLIPEAEMREWVNNTVERILSLQPQRILELGCGTGMLMFRVAPHCQKYVATDFSQKVLQELQYKLDGLEDKLPQVILSHRTADNFEGIESNAFDTVILNSVSQHFPNIEYMLGVMEGAVNAVKPGGQIFVGDVRSLPLLEAFHTSIQLYKASDSLTRQQLFARVRSRLSQEGELVIDPAFFTALKQHLPKIGNVSIQVKHGSYHNELTRFRYDVTLHIGDENPVPTQISWLDWQEQQLTLPKLRQLLLDNQPEILGLRGIPNARLVNEASTLEWLYQGSQPETVGEWRSQLTQQHTGIDPEQLWDLTDNLPYVIDIKPSQDYCYDVILQNRDLLGTKILQLTENVSLKPWNYYANQPQQVKITKNIVPQIRSFLAEKLPDYMIPGSFVMLDSLPITPNGKVDRKALPALNQTRSQAEDFVAPRNPCEEVLVEIWAEVLAVEQIGIHDNFFQLGGHSLLATQVMSRVREVFKVELPLRSLFDSPRVAGLADNIEQLRRQEQGLQVPQIEVISRHQNLPLSYAQKRLWFLDQLIPNNPFYNIPQALRVTGNLNVAALEQTLSEIVRRHEALRTTLQLIDNEPVQVITPAEKLILPVVDLRQLPVEQLEAEALQQLTQAAKQPFNLAQDKLIRCQLFQISEQDYLLLVVIHHIVSDGWSIGLFIKELGTIYEALAIGSPSPLPELSIQYADFAQWQQQYLNSEVLEKQLAYWKQQLAGAPAVLNLPTDRPRPQAQTFRGATQSFILPSHLVESIKLLSQRQGVSIFMTYLAAFQTLLYRYTGQPDIVVGSPIANRHWSQVEELIGFFVNTLALRTTLEDDLSFLELLNQVREVALGAYGHQDLPFEQLVEALQPVRDLSHTPLFQVMFVLQNAPMPSLALGDLTLEPLVIETNISRFDLVLYLEQTNQGLVGSWEYNTDLFDATTIARIAGNFQTLLEAVVINPQQKIVELPLLSAIEQQQLLKEWNNTQVDYPENICINELFETQVKLTPDAVAVIFGEQQLTYQQLNNQANQLAHYLQTLGVKPDVLVGIFLERSLEMVVGLLGILKAGGAYVPLDPSFPKERLGFMLEDAEVQVLLTQEQLLAGLPQLTIPTQVICLNTAWETIAQHSQANLVNAVTASNLAYVIYTSGSTGKPKGVQICHPSLVNFIRAMQQELELASSDKLLSVTTITFDIAGLEIFLPLTVGASVEIVSREVATDGIQLTEKLANGVTIMQATPATWNMLLLAGWQGNKQLKILCGGEALSKQLANQLLERCQCLWNLYGPTETTIWSTIYQVKLLDKIVAIGRPIANTQVYILDQNLQPLPVGIPGELHIGGDGLAKGYLKRPELTAEKFINNPFSDQPAAKLYKTGDLARYLPDGTIEYLGRIDYQVKIRGFRIELGEIESVINQYSAVQQAVVIAREDLRSGKYLVAYIVGDRNSPITSSHLRSFLKDKLPEYMIPGVFVILDALPLTPNGKVDRKALPPPELSPEINEDFTTPQNPIEEILAGIWASVLGIEQVSINHNFFELGGHSLLATQVISRVRSDLAVELPLRNLFEFPTIAQLAEQIELAQKSTQQLLAPPILPITREGEHPPLSFAQQRLWLLDQLQPNSAVYNIPVAVELNGELNLIALENTFNEIVRRHEALRTNFMTVDGQPVQIIHPSYNLPLPVVDLRSLPTNELEIEIERLSTAEAQRPFDLASDQLVRVTVLQLTQTKNILLLTIHHLVSDGWSMGVLLKELAALYQAFCNQQPSPLPELSIQYLDFAIWQRQWLTPEVVERQLNYWKQQLQGAPAVLQLPTDRPRPAIQSFQGAHQEFALPTELTQALTLISKQQGTTLFITLLAAFQTLLYRYSGQDDICIGTPIANRNHIEIEQLIGFFVNTLILRTDLSGNPSFKKLLSRVREVALGAYVHQDLPFEQLVEALQPARNLSYTPLFQVMFGVQKAPMPALEFADLTLTPLEVETKTSKFDLTLLVEETDQGLVGYWEYNTDLFDSSTIARMAGHFQTLLSAIVSNLDQRLSDLPLLTAAEQQMLKEWNDTQAEIPQNVSINELFETQVQKTPDAVAVVFGEQQLTYQQLNNQANQLAHYLQTLGVKPDVFVGICVERSLEILVGILGILKAGGAYVPLDPTFPKERIKFMLEDAQVQVLLTQEKLLAGLANLSVIAGEPSTNGKPKVVCLDRDWDAIALHQHNPVNHLTSGNLAYVIYTSGSTGKPKGVLITHKNLIHSTIARINYYGEPVSRFLLLSSFAFDSSVAGIFWTLCQGGSLFLPPEGLQKDLLQLNQLITQNQISHLLTLPSVYALLLEQSQTQQLTSLSTVIVAGESCPKELIAQHNQLLSQTSLLNEYGPTEGTVWSSVYNCNSDCPNNIVPIGQPIANTQIYILDANLKLVPIGVLGEAYIGGIGLARGYLNRPDLTAEKFISNFFSNTPGTRLYKTGDLARYLPDGNIEFIGRIDTQVKIRGFRIELGEIEAVAIQHPGVREIVVIALEDIPGNKQLVAYVVPHQEQAPTVSELRNFIKEKLPEYMVPAIFMMLETLPITATGKVDRKALPAPNQHQRELEAVVVARTLVEEVLVGIWAEVLRREQISIHDNFFELGGHSLLGAQLISRIRSIFKIELPLRKLFEFPTIASLAPTIESATQENTIQFLPILPVSREQILPASFPQQQMWLFAQQQPNLPSYNNSLLLWLPGSLNVAALEQALDTIIKRHEAWRTTFSIVDGSLVQIIQPTATLALPIINLEEFPQEQQKTEILRLARLETLKLFDLSEDLLIRVTLIRLNAVNYCLILTLHHIIYDGVSLNNVFYPELEILYKAYCEGKPSPLPELPIQYADFAVWQRQSLQQDLLKPHIEYWQKQLANLPILELLTDRPRPAVDSYRGATQRVELSKTLTQKLKALAIKEGATLFMTLLAAFKTLLCRYSSQEDIPVGIVTAGLNRPEINGLVGLFINLLVLRTDLSGKPNFRQLLQRVREVTLEAHAHKDMPFEQLVDQLQLEHRRLGQNPLFQVMFVLDPPMPTLDSGWKIDYMDIENDTAMSDLTLELYEESEGLSGVFEYSTDLFDATTIERMVGHYCALLESIVANPEQNIFDLQIVTAAEQQQLQQWNNTEFDYPENLCLHQLFEMQVAKTPDAVAVTFEEEELTYQELNQKANQLAHYLQSLGVKPDVMVGICIERSLEMAVGILGILKAGGAYVPLDPNYPQERLAFMLADTQVPVLLTQQELVSRLPTHQAKVICFDSDWQEISQLNQGNISSGVTVDNLAYVIYTSGSTGRPKGICLEQRPLLNLLHWHYSCLLTGARTLQFASLSFDASFHEMFATWGTGGKLFIIPENLRLDVIGLGRYISEHKIEKVILPVVLLQQLAESLGGRGIAALQPEMFSNLKEITTTGEQLQITPAIAQFFKSLPHCSFHNHYGPSETHVVTALSLTNHPDHWEYHPPIGVPIAKTKIYLVDQHFNLVPVGVPGELCIGGVSLARGYLNRPDLTAEKFIPNPFSEDSPLSSKARLYRTGDLARYLPDGNIEYLGRIDHQVKIRGFRIELDEIEALLVQHPDVQEAVAIAREDIPGDKRLVAYIVSNLIPNRLPLQTECLVEFGQSCFKLTTEDISVGGICLTGVPDNFTPGKTININLVLPGTSQQEWLEGEIAWHKGQRVCINFNLNSIAQKILQTSYDHFLEKQGLLKILQRTITQNLRQFLQEKLPRYMIPERFIVINSLPLTPNGKIDRKALPAPVFNQQHLTQNYVAPRTPVEEVIAGIWAKVLGIEQVGIHDNFLEIGGQSILAMQVISRLRDIFQTELPLRSLFEFPTVAGMAQKIEIMRPQQLISESVNAKHPQAETSIPPLKRLPRPEVIPVSFTQQRLWFLEQLTPGSAKYNLPLALEFKGLVNLTALQQSCQAIIQRHEILRTNFSAVNGEPVQLIFSDIFLNMEVFDLEEIPPNQKQTEAQNILEMLVKRPFNLETEPLVRVAIIHLNTVEHIVLLNMHHIVSDGWSMGVILRELTELYDSFNQEKPNFLPDLPIQYADYTIWQRQWLQGQLLEQQLAYWKQQLSGDLPVLQLPTDRPRPAVQTFAGAAQTLVINQSLTAAIIQLAHQENATLYITLLAAFNILLYRYTSNEDILVGTPISGRHWSEIENLIGFFVNTHVIRTNLSGTPSFKELLMRVREATLEAYSHKELPFEKLVEAIQPDRNLSQNPLVQVMFALQNIPLPELSSGWEFSQLSLHTETAKFDLSLQLSEVNGEIIGEWEYNTDLFDASTIERMSGHFETLLTAIINDPEQRITELPLLTAAEIQQIEVWNHTAIDYPADTCIHQLFEAQVKKTPDAIAAIFEEQQLTYSELNIKANQLAHYLRSLGVKPEVLVGICIERSLEMVVAILGILKAGGAYVPLDPSYPQERLAFIVENTQVSIILTQHALISILSQSQAQLISLDTQWQSIAQHSGKNPITNITQNNLAYIIYTSGSTGTPKGVAVAHKGLCNLAQAEIKILDLQPGSRVLQFVSFSFDVSINDVVMTLCSGATLGIAPKEYMLPGDNLIKLLRDLEITHIELPVSVLQALEFEDLPALKTIIIGGESFPANLVAQWGVNRRLFNAYGPTESTVCATLAQLSESNQQPHIGRPIANTQIYILDQQLQLVPVGVPGEMYIGGIGLARGYLNRPDLTAERFIPNPFQAAGEKNSDLKSTSDRFYKTGDLARYLPDGNIEYLGRIDHQVKIRGFRIELGEIETALLKHPDVREVVVMALPDSRGDKRLVAYIVSQFTLDRMPYQRVCLLEYEGNPIELTSEDISKGGVCLVGVPATWEQRKRVRLRILLPGASQENWLEGNIAWQQGQRVGIQFALTPLEQDLLNQSVDDLIENQGMLKALQRTITGNLRKLLKQKLPDYMIPYSFVMLRSLPLNPNGKVDRRALAARNDGWQPGIEKNLVAPRTPREEQLARIWAEVLGVEQVGIYNNFFELGGHSLLSVKLISQIKEIFRVKLPLYSFFENPTVAGLSQLIDFVSQNGDPSSVAANQVLDLNAEVVLDSSIYPDPLTLPMLKEPANIFLTGATGFLGAFLLNELLTQTQADIYCLVRAANLEAGKQKIQRNLERYLLSNQSQSNRIIPVIGDLSQPLLGMSSEQFQMLATKLDMIYHNGAVVNLTYPYSALKAANVLGTQEVLRLACQIKVKPTHFISTSGIFFSDAYNNVKVILEEDNLESSEGLGLGYSQSKWVAEKLVAIARERGLPICIYRPGRIAGHSQTGIWTTTDLLCRIIKGCIQMGSIPDIYWMQDISPVDYVSKTIIHLSRQPESLGKAFHVVNPQPLEWGKLVDCLCSFGYPLQRLPYQNWRSQLMNIPPENVLYPLLNIFSNENISEEATLALPKLDAQNTRAGLASSSIVCPPPEEGLLITYLSYFISSGFLASPPPVVH
ncbi:amino acid adenylation domain protein [Crinalium epipsammum PCC 9333]|uniref:Amino acid adenylation domain protein n=1 Tax=Crinalium epipsammum PCC 9333 TaxID=1173022 RepID=K9VWW9_9CYAN|nr:non-ribosomal peptide synthetase [Crinalium epipsammum]AFZ12486.1 amino acid adenylation domain protein [Crinalium epipsammum PCC 9333]